MKTEYKPIAMRCTQEQFDSIKDRIPLPILDIYNFENYGVLINSYNNNNAVSNLSIKDTSLDISKIIPFDGELFLDYCGREKLDRPYQDLINYMSEEYGLLEIDLKEIERLVLKDKVWKGSEIKANFGNGWEDVFSGYEYRIKPQPDYTAEEIEEKLYLLRSKFMNVGKKNIGKIIKDVPEMMNILNEIEALERKAKENGQKVIIKFEEL